MKTKKSMVAMVLISLALSTAVALAADAPQMPGILANARYVYVTSYDGGPFNTELMPEDRAAISHVEDAIQKWGKLILVYRSQEADIILAVQSRPSEDVLAVYEAHRGDAGSRPSETYLWRVMGRGGLQKSEMPLFSQFEKAWEQIAK
jgi:hypothetical protein